MQFTKEQLRIITHANGHARVSAVAGSGKTTTMVARIGHLLTQGVSADKILVLMFNRSARDNFEETMRKRLTDQKGAFPEVRTFHSLGLRLVNSFTKRGSLSAFKLVTEEYLLEKMARKAANDAYRNWVDDEEYLSGDDLETFLGYIDLVKAAVADEKKVFGALNLPSRLGFFPAAYMLFEEMRVKQRVRFYSDLIHEPLTAMLDNDELATWVGNRVDHIIVDEYQDINETQHHLLKFVAGTRADVMVVGDVDQCIYEWRGAKPDYITTRFGKDFKNPVQYQLSYTFRYGHQISLAANHLIVNNRNRDQKQCVSHESTGNSTLVCLEESGKHPILHEIRSWLSGGRFLSEAVVLVRLYAQTVPVELALLEAGIEYRVEGSSEIFECVEISALLGSLRLVNTSFGDIPAERRQILVAAMLCHPHLGIRREDMEALVAAIASDVELGPQILRDAGERDYPLFIRKRFEQTAATWEWLKGCDALGSAAPLLSKLVDKLALYDFFHSFSARAATAENRVKTCDALIDFARMHNYSVTTLLEKMNEYSGRSGANQPRDADTLLITSIHRAKGLEWPLVLLPGLEDGSFPFSREKDKTGELEDERRLFYVAITRTIERLVCCHPMDAELKRAMAVNSCRVPFKGTRASRFLFEANIGLSRQLSEALEGDRDRDEAIRTDDASVAEEYQKAVGGRVVVLEVGNKKDGMAGEESKEDHNRDAVLDMKQIHDGMQIFHSSFGVGTVTAIKDRRQGRLTVNFQDHGEMILLAKYAKLVVC
jgi:DNA helicase-2/ATP-dependent DNA helicase PcrA